ncbi:MAG: tetratricopeptide repeat protein, partial [Clostridiaceae bacterium]|nr:tetratricopeptide repeat protein [Clostridiaceae bacterium]
MSKYKFLIPIALFLVLAFLFSYNRFLGFAFLALVLLYLVFINRVSLYNILAGVAYKKKDMDKALAWLKKAYHVRNSKPKIKMLYSYLLLKSGNVEEAGKTLEDIMNLKLNFEDERMAKSNYALVLWKRGRLEDAVALLEEVYTDYKT